MKKKFLVPKVYSRRFFLRTALMSAGLSLGVKDLFSIENNADDFFTQSNWENSFDTDINDLGHSAQIETNIPIFHPQTLQYTEKAIAMYRQIIEKGGWEPLPILKNFMIGDKDPLIESLRTRLIASGDLLEKFEGSSFFDTYVHSALKRFQNRHGLPETGFLDDITQKTMNIRPQTRLKQLKVNLHRIRSHINVPLRYIVVNIPAAQIEAVENNRIILRHTAIVGKVDRKTPIMHSKINQIIINPYWNVPISIIKKDIIPIVRKDPEYLTKNNIHIISSHGKYISADQIDWNTEEAAKYRFRQDPGKINAMASVKINFPSPENVYMHDTPVQSAFDNLMRFDSSGCVRVQNIRDLVAWILKNTHRWDRKKFEETIKTGVNTPVSIKDPVDLYFSYISAWSNKLGVVHFRDDIYGYDNLTEIKEYTE